MIFVWNIWHNITPDKPKVRFSSITHFYYSKQFHLWHCSNLCCHLFLNVFYGHFKIYNLFRTSLGMRTEALGEKTTWPSQAEVTCKPKCRIKSTALVITRSFSSKYLILFYVFVVLETKQQTHKNKIKWLWISGIWHRPNELYAYGIQQNPGQGLCIS